MMTVSWAEVEPARTMGRAIATAVRCASTGGRSAYEPAVTALSELPTAPTGAVLAVVVRLLVEDNHPGGLDGDDIRDVLGRCTADALSWLPGAAFSTRILVAVLSSALGVHEAGVTYAEILPPSTRQESADWIEPELTSTGRRSSAAPGTDDRQSPPTTAQYNRHAPLLIGSLLQAAGRPLASYLDVAFADIARSETMEMP